MNNTFIPRAGELTDELGCGDLKIIISDALPKFTSDAIALARFAAAGIRRSDRVADLGSGTGILALMVHGLTGANVVGFEIQPELCEISRRSCELNNLGDAVRFEQVDYHEAYRQYNGAFTAAVCNPPYFAESSGAASAADERRISRTMPDGGLDRLCETLSRLLRTGGRAFICYPAAAIVDLLCALRTAGLEPKQLSLMPKDAEKAKKLALVEARKGGGKGLRVY